MTTAKRALAIADFYFGKGDGYREVAEAMRDYYNILKAVPETDLIKEADEFLTKDYVEGRTAKSEKLVSGLLAMVKLERSDSQRLISHIKRNAVGRNGELITVEVSERLGDWQSDGSPKYHAQIQDKPSVWAAGNSMDEALGNLVLYHSELGIDVKYMGKQPR